MEFLVGEKLEFFSKYFLLGQDILVIHLLDESWIFDAIGFQELHVGHLECLPNGLGYQLGL